MRDRDTPPEDQSVESVHPWQSVIQTPPGYRHTAVGIVPTDWDVKAVGDVAEVKGGKRLPKGTNLTDQQTPHPYIRVTDMHPGGVQLDEIRYVPEDVFSAISNYVIGSADLFISVAGTLGIVAVPPGVGRVLI